jgi:hypothetical protein
MLPEKPGLLRLHVKRFSDTDILSYIAYTHTHIQRAYIHTHIHRHVGGSGDATFAGDQADDPAILFLEWLTNTAIANQHRIGTIWPPIHYHFMQLMQVFTQIIYIYIHIYIYIYIYITMWPPIHYHFMQLMQIFI